MATMSPNFTTERRVGTERRVHSTSTAKSGMNALDWVALALSIIGGINWGLVGLFNFDLVATLFGEMSALSRVIYTAVGLSALYMLYTATKMGRHH